MARHTDPAALRADLIRLASSLPKGSEDRRVILAEILREAASVGPIMADVTELSVWLHCKMTGYGRIFAVGRDLKDAEEQLRVASMAVAKAISTIDGVHPDVWDSHVDTAPGRTLLAAQRIKLVGGVTPEQIALISDVIRTRVREVRGLAPVPATVA